MGKQLLNETCWCEISLIDTVSSKVVDINQRLYWGWFGLYKTYCTLLFGFIYVFQIIGTIIVKLESYFYSSFVVYSPGNGVNGIAIELRLWEEKCSTGMSFISVKGEKQWHTKWWMSSDRGVSNWGRLCLYQMSLILYYIFKHHFSSKYMKKEQNNQYFICTCVFRYANY